MAQPAQGVVKQRHSSYRRNIQLGMRRGNTNFNTSFTSDHNVGILPLTNGQYRQNIRLNVDQGIGDKVDFSSSITYGINRNDYDPNDSQSWFSFMQMPPDVDLRIRVRQRSVDFYPQIPVNKSPSARANPLYTSRTRTSASPRADPRLRVGTVSSDRTGCASRQLRHGSPEPPRARLTVVDTRRAGPARSRAILQVTRRTTSRITRQSTRRSPRSSGRAQDDARGPT